MELQQLVHDGDDDDENHPHHQPPPSPPPYLGLLLAVLSSLFFSLCSVIVKWMRDVDPIALAAYRYVGVLLPAVPMVIYGEQPLVARDHRVLLLLRSVAGASALMLSFYAFRHMPLADASVIVFSVPVFTTLFARLFLREACGWCGGATVAATLVGVTLVTRPTWLFGAAVQPLGGATTVTTTGVDAWSAAAALAAALCGANAYVLLRALKRVHFAVVMTHFGAYALAQCAIIAAIGGAICLPACGGDRLLVVALAAFSFLGQILLTIALQIEQAGPVAVARTADIVFAFGWQVALFGETPNAYSMVGAVLVLASVLVVGVRKWLLTMPVESRMRRKFAVLTM